MNALKKVYDGFIKSLKQVSGTEDTEAAKKTLCEVIDAIVDNLSTEDVSLLLYCGKVSDEDYVYAHSLNVCLISVRIGVRLGYDRARLEAIGVAALMHSGRDTGFPEKVFEDAGHDKETEDIVKLADIYDTLTHPPSHRTEMTPCDTMTSVIDSCSFAQTQLVKILLEEISMYPEGSWVRLNTGETAKVIRINREFPLRPVVEVMRDAKRTEDLSQNKMIYIIRALTEKEVGKITR